MERIEGIIRVEERGEGSKSQGSVSVLMTNEGKEYILYRAGMLAQNDPFFTRFNATKVIVNGTPEETGYMCVSSVQAEENIYDVPEEPEAPVASTPMFIGPTPVQTTEPQQSKPKRLPRKLKKILKKNLKK